MVELSFTQLDDLNNKVVSSADREVNEYMSGFLMPRLSALMNMLNAADISCELTMDMTYTPGVSVHIAEGYDLYATFMAVGEDEDKEILRLAAYRADATDAKKIEEVSLVIHESSFWKDAEAFLFISRLFLTGATINADAINAVSDDEDIAEGAEYPEETSRIMPRINGLLDIFSDIDVIEEMGTAGVKKPYIVIAGEEFAAIARYETTSSEDVYLLHMGTFIPFMKPVSSDAIEQFCRGFNQKYFSIRASVSGDAPEAFAMEGADGYIRLQMCSPEYGAYLEVEDYEQLMDELADAAAETEEFLEELIQL